MLLSRRSQMRRRRRRQKLSRKLRVNPRHCRVEETSLNSSFEFQIENNSDFKPPKKLTAASRNHYKSILKEKLALAKRFSLSHRSSEVARNTYVKVMNCIKYLHKLEITDFSALSNTIAQSASAATNLGGLKMPNIGELMAGGTAETILVLRCVVFGSQ